MERYPKSLWKLVFKDELRTLVAGAVCAWDVYNDEMGCQQRQSSLTPARTTLRTNHHP